MLRDSGERVKKIIDDTKPASVGDLVISIDAVLDELLESEDKGVRNRVRHVRGLFRELVHGEEYTVNGDQPVAQEDQQIGTSAHQCPPASGSMWTNMPISGVIASGVFPNPQPLPPNPAYPYAPPSNSFEDDDDYEEEYDEGLEDDETLPAIEEEPEDEFDEREQYAYSEPEKPFKRRWWQSKA